MNRELIGAAHIAPVILVIDDQADNLRVVGQLLAQAGFDVVPAMTGQEGIDLATEAPPDLVLLDMRMPGMSGFQVLRILQDAQTTRDIPVIFLTADIERDSLIRAFGAGAVDYITKPFVPEELLVRARTHIELKQSRDALRRIATEKQQVAETVAHDLRNYFASMLFAADMLRDPALDTKTRLRLIDSISASGDAGVLFLQSFLDEQSLQAQSAALEPVPAQELLVQTVELMRRQADAKAIAVQVQGGERLTLLGQRSAALHVLQNLLSNAIKYSPTATEIVVTATQFGMRGRLSVLDRGPGIAKDEQSRLFERFASLSNQPTQGESSTGLGLALARQRARTIGGDLWYEDREGGGAAFVFELPLA